MALATAHPHIFVDAKATVVFDNTGAVVGFRHEWTLDQGTSAYAVQGYDTNGDGEYATAELQVIADEDMTSLVDYAYYTYAGEGPDLLALGTGINPVMRFENQLATLSFDLPLLTPYKIMQRLEIAINDPQFYTAITFPSQGDVALENAPAGCDMTMQKPRGLDPVLEERLLALGPDVIALPPELASQMRGVQGSIVISCSPDAVPVSTAPDAAQAMAPKIVHQTIRVGEVSPFGGPPPEPGFTLPRTGLLGSIATAQADFYLGLQGALGRLKTDWTAFWVLGGLSFLYGIFHAAGPGHGKVVIASYVLANEHQRRRGIFLSFVSAMLQSIVAVVFVLVAAAVLGMTSLAMGDAVNMIGLTSYALVMVLGLYLIIRKLFFGHRHAHVPTARSSLAHRHLHGHDHEPQDDETSHHPDLDANHEAHDHTHIVTPAQLKGGWVEQLAVVASVGIRPCSGALIVLVFALSQGLLAAGIIAVLLMGLGTGITVAILATIAVSAKGWARRIGGANSRIASGVVWWLELGAAVTVFGFGLLFVLASV